VLKIGGKEVPMVVGRETKLEGEFKDPAVSIEAASAQYCQFSKKAGGPGNSRQDYH
jgi:hypothetical protein